MGRVPDAEKDKMLQEMVEAGTSSTSDVEEEEVDSEHTEFVEKITKSYQECFLTNTESELQEFRTYCSEVSVLVLKYIAVFSFHMVKFQPRMGGKIHMNVYLYSLWSFMSLRH